MNDRNANSPRKVAIPDHLWQLYEDMAQKMGTDRDGLLCQAMFVFARLNGFIDAPAIHQTLAGASLASAPTPGIAGSPAVVEREPAGSAEPTGPMATAGAQSMAPDDTAALSAQAVGHFAGEDALEAE